jgi:repressor LexA
MVIIYLGGDGMRLGDKIKQRRLELGLTLEDVGKVVGVAKSTVNKWESGDIENMRKDKIELLAKALRVHPLWIMEIEDKTYYGTKKVPVLGAVAAGEPIFAQESYDVYIEIDNKIPVDFCLKVKGDSMVDARILDGDMVFVKKQPTVENGEITVVLIDDDVTLKRFYKNNGGIILKPENSKYQPKYYTEKDFKNIRILGKAMFFQSKL